SSAVRCFSRSASEAALAAIAVSLSRSALAAWLSCAACEASFALIALRFVAVARCASAIFAISPRTSASLVRVAASRAEVLDAAAGAAACALRQTVVAPSSSTSRQVLGNGWGRRMRGHYHRDRPRMRLPHPFPKTCLLVLL